MWSVWTMFFMFPMLWVMAGYTFGASITYCLTKIRVYSEGTTLENYGISFHQLGMNFMLQLNNKRCGKGKGNTLLGINSYCLKDIGI